jgi:UDP-N-acetylmuramoyl-L-alanyl-D-glutamate--2,6-diaminopimelate ligase
MAAAHALGVPADAWAPGIAATSGIPGRMELVDEGQPFTAIVDFAHTPNALHGALSTARELAGSSGRVIVVFGCAGERDAGKRPMMGTVAGHLADLTVVTAEDPRHERLDDIMSEIAEGLRSAGRREDVDFWRVADRYAAIRRAAGAAGPSDVVIVCGKGHEQSLCFGDTEYPWDDRAALRCVMRDRPYGDLPTSHDR